MVCYILNSVNDLKYSQSFEVLEEVIKLLVVNMWDLYGSIGIKIVDQGS